MHANGGVGVGVNRWLAWHLALGVITAIGYHGLEGMDNVSDVLTPVSKDWAV